MFSNDNNNRSDQIPNEYQNQPQGEDSPGTSNRQNIKSFVDNRNYYNRYGARSHNNSRMSYNTIQPQQLANYTPHNNTLSAPMNVGQINTNFQLQD